MASAATNMPQAIKQPDAATSSRPCAADAWTTRGLLVLATSLVGLASHQNGGNYSPAAVGWLTAGLAAGGCAVARLRIPLVERMGAKAFGAVLAIALLVQIGLLAGGFLSRPQPASALRVLPFTTVAVAGALAALLLPAVFSSRRAWRITSHIAFAGLLAAFAWAGTRAIEASPLINQDVLFFQGEACRALLQDGADPYAIDFPDMSSGSSRFYAPGTQVEVAPNQWRLKFGFPYPPLTLLLDMPGYLAAEGETRYSQLGCILLAAVLMAYARPEPVGRAVAGLFLLAPAGLLVLSQGWTEPFVIVLLAASVFCAWRMPRALPIAVGLFWAIKQYAVLSAPLILLLVPDSADGERIGRPRWRVLAFATKAAVTAAVVTVPFALWDLRAFWHSVVTLQLHQPFRADALSYLAALSHAGGPVLPSAVAFAAMIGVSALAAWRLPRTPAGFAAAAAVAFLAFFALNKQAFANYHYFVVGAAYCAAAAGKPPEPGSPHT